MRPSLTTGVAFALLAATACGMGRADRERELAIAERVSEQLTSEFADSVSGTDRPAQAPLPSPQYAAAAADAAERGVDLEAPVASRRPESVEACPAPAVDGSAFRQVWASPLPVALNAPPTYTLAQRMTRVVGRDTMSATLESGIDKMWFSRSTTEFAYHDDGEWNVTSHCDDMVAGMHVHFDAALKRGAAYRRGVSASYRLPSGAYLVVHAEFHDAPSQAAALYALRTVQFRSVW